jgi:hypothetical protein
VSTAFAIARDVFAVIGALSVAFSISLPLWLTWQDRQAAAEGTTTAPAGAEALAGRHTADRLRAGGPAIGRRAPRNRERQRMSTNGKRTCEHRLAGSGWPCEATATFRVSREHRTSDAQDSCRRHLHSTVEALMQADNVAVLVMRIRGAGA